MEVKLYQSCRCLQFASETCDAFFIHDGHTLSPIIIENIATSFAQKLKHNEIPQNNTVRILRVNQSNNMFLF